MKNYIVQSQHELASLSRRLGAHMSALDSILNRGINKKLRTPKAAKQLKAASLLSVSALENSLLRSATSSFLKQNQSSSNVSNTSSGQSMADLAAALNRSMLRDL